MWDGVEGVEDLPSGGADWMALLLIWHGFGGIASAGCCHRAKEVFRNGKLMCVPPANAR